MEITFENARLQKLCNSAGKLNGKYGPRQSALIQRRLVDLATAETLEDMRIVPGRCHELTQNLTGCFAVDLVHPDRLVFRVANKPRPVNASGALDWSAVTAIEIVDIVDYHE